MERQDGQGILTSNPVTRLTRVMTGLLWALRDRDRAQLYQQIDAARAAAKEQR